MLLPVCTVRLDRSPWECFYFMFSPMKLRSSVRTDRHDEGSSWFRNFSNAPKTLSICNKVGLCILFWMRGLLTVMLTVMWAYFENN